MFALSLVVIAGLIGGRGLGDVVTNGLYSNPALAVLAGIAIVIMAIALDRATAAIADRTDPARRQLTDEGRRRARKITLAVFGAIALIVIAAKALGADAIYPDEFETASTVYDSNIQDTVLGWINDALEYVQDPTTFIFSITDWIGNFILERMLQPVQNLLMDTPWFIVLGLPHGDRLRAERPAPGRDRVPDARADRRHRRLGAGDGHRLAGARGDRHRRRDRHRGRSLGSGEPARREDRSDPSSTRCRRSRSSSTSSRSST